MRPLENGSQVTSHQGTRQNQGLRGCTLDIYEYISLFNAVYIVYAVVI